MRQQTFRGYQLEVEDSDGDSQQYRFKEPGPFVALSVARKLLVKYGHKRVDSRPVTMHLHELTEGAI
mgnify:CR=1 FL=1